MFKLMSIRKYFTFLCSKLLLNLGLWPITTVVGSEIMCWPAFKEGVTVFLAHQIGIS